jgi:hypothetical protein
MKIVDDHEVSESEKITRFICGAILGLAVSVAITYKFHLSSFGAIFFVALVSILGCGILALIHGDRFWAAIIGRVRR